MPEDEKPVTGTGEGETPTQETPAAPKAETAEELQARLAKMEAALKDANKEAADRRKKLEAFEKAEAERKQAEMTELQKAQAEAKSAQEMLKVLKLRETRREIAEKVGLPIVFANRILGETPEEMETDARAMLASLPKQAAPRVGPTNPTDGRPQAETDAQRRNRLGLTPR